MKRMFTIAWLALVGVAAAITLVAGSPALAGSQAAPQSSELYAPATPIACAVITGRVVASPNSSTSPIVSSLNGVAVISADDVWAVGTYRNTAGADRTLIERWDGTAWSIIPSPNVGNGGNYLLEVSGVASDDVWAVGWAVGVGAISMHWDGEQWTAVTVPNLGSVSSNLQGVKALASDNVWAVGSFGHAGQEQTVSIRWNGTAWLVIPSVVLGSMSAFLDIDAISANDIWAVGKYRTSGSSPEQTLTARWNGTVWSVVSSPNAGSFPNFLNGVTMVGANDVWAVGTYDIESPKTLALRYNGSAWSIVNSAGNGTLHEVVAFSASDVWAVGADYDENTGTVSPVTGRWNGSSWSLGGGPALGPSSSTLFNVARGTSGDLWAVGKGRAAGSTVDEAYVAHRAASQWNVVPDQTDGSMMNGLYGIDAVSSNDIWAVGSTGVSARTLIERWDGSNWNIVASPSVDPGSSYLWAVSGTSYNNVWAVGHSKSGAAPGQTLAMRWNGTAWSIVASPNIGSGPNFLYGVAALSMNDAWAVGSSSSGEPLVMRWNGTQWSVTATPDVGDEATLRDVYALSANAAWAVGSYRNGSNPEQTLVMRWDGTAWAQVTSPNTGGVANYLRAVTATSASDVWAVGSTGQNGSSQALTLHWNGAQWSQVSTGFAATMSTLYDVDATQPGSVWAVGGYKNGGGSEQTLALRWDGAGWSAVASPNANSQRNMMYAVAAAATNDVWAVGQYSSDSTTLTLSEQFGPASFSDVPTDNTFYSYVQCMVCRGIVNGYSDGTFRPNNNITRGQLSKVVSNSAAFSEDPGPQRFEDIPVGSTFYDWVNRLAARGYIGGYACGGEGEPCGETNLPYFRPNSNATRGQITKIVSNAAGFNDDPAGQTFEDVAPGSAFYLWVERLASRGIMGGYACGSEGEPCGSDNRPYFRPGNNATRGQSSKVVANAFFPGCEVR